MGNVSNSRSIHKIESRKMSQTKSTPKKGNCHIKNKVWEVKFDISTTE